MSCARATPRLLARFARLRNQVAPVAAVALADLDANAVQLG